MFVRMLHIPVAGFLSAASTQDAGFSVAFVSRVARAKAQSFSSPVGGPLPSADPVQEYNHRITF